jgi:riboflavin biosynthesis pyrimidine reductase
VRALIDRVASPGAEEAAQPGRELSDDDLRRLYAAPRPDWLRVNMVSTVDGAGTGPDGLTGSVNNAADHRVFHALRALADAVVVGAGTARAEGYRPSALPTVVVSRRGQVPPRLQEGGPGSVLLVTCTTGAIQAAREQLGTEAVLVLGHDSVDLGALRPALAERGLRRLLSEGGPHLLRDLVAAGAVDELCTTVVPRLLAGEGPRIATGQGVDVGLDLRLLLEDQGTLLARWFLSPSGAPSR